MNISNNNKKFITSKLVNELGLTHVQATNQLMSHVKKLNKLLCLSEYIEWVSMVDPYYCTVKKLDQEGLKKIQLILTNKEYALPPLELNLHELISLASEDKFSLFKQENTIYQAESIKDILLLNQQEFDLIQEIIHNIK
jgi:hypothetical protein